MMEEVQKKKGQTSMYEDAVEKGSVILSSGGTKADAARTTYSILEEEPRDVLIAAFIEGATVTPKSDPR